MRLLPLLLVALLSLALGFSCASAGPVSVLGPSVTPTASAALPRRDGDFAPAIPGPEVWDALALTR